MVEIRMPEAGFNITEGKIVQWYKKIGDKVEEGENIVSVETDKITVDIPSEVAGVLHDTRCKEGEVVPVGSVVGIITEEGESPPAPDDEIIEQVQTSRPYPIAGWSLGGIIAFEMVRQMEQMNRKVDFLALIDVSLPNRELLKPVEPRRLI